ncbi:hypothetical protein GCM10008083_10720 [Ulvibacter litoralis]|nr:hypothetical protein GCM10008083_10720 [Ulvibacter litoralis]
MNVKTVRVAKYKGWLLGQPLKNRFMNIETSTLWNRFNTQVYFFILKKVKDKDAANEILQNSFLKIHLNIAQLKDVEKAKAWTFQIARNEIINYFKAESKTVHKSNLDAITTTENYEELCCFERFVTNLPKEYNEVIDLVYLKGKKQAEAAELLGISIANVKARIRRSKAILTKNFNECCKFDLNDEGKLVGESNCSYPHQETAIKN